MSDIVQTKNWYIPSENRPQTDPEAIQNQLLQIDKPIFLMQVDGHLGVAGSGTGILHGDVNTDTPGARRLLAYAPPLTPQALGDSVFKKRFGLKFAYVMGAMANGIASVEMVEAAGKAGMLGFFGAGGLSLDEIRTAVEGLKQSMGATPFGFNLIHTPGDPDHEMATVDLYLKSGVRLVSAAAYMRLTLPLVYFRVKGIHQDPQGHIVCPNKVIAKISRIEVARQFFSPPPEKIIKQLLENNMITQQEADLAARIPVADTMTAEADSGGHTDNRPALALLPTIIALRNEMTAKHQFEEPLLVGLGGGIATPQSAAAAFSMGAAYVLTGSVNQACVEAGISETVRQMLADAEQADVVMAPAADMFEMGVKVQVLKRGTMFPIRAAKLYEYYCRYDCFEDIPAKERETLEKTFFKCCFADEWAQTKRFFEQRDPKQLQKAAQNPKYQMALVFRSYLGRSSKWAVSGVADRKIDYQIWCGPAMGAFNEWVKGSFLEKAENRKVVTVALNLLLGACVVTRAGWLRAQGVALPNDIGAYGPLPLSVIQQRIGDDAG